MHLVLIDWKIYDCVVTGDTKVMDDFLPFADECTSSDFTRADPQGQSDFYTLCDTVKGLPNLRARERTHFARDIESSSLVAEASRLLIDAEKQYDQASH